MSTGTDFLRIPSPIVSMLVILRTTVQSSVEVQYSIKVQYTIKVQYNIKEQYSVKVQYTIKIQCNIKVLCNMKEQHLGMERTTWRACAQTIDMALTGSDDARHHRAAQRARALRQTRPAAFAAAGRVFCNSGARPLFCYSGIHVHGPRPHA